VPASLNLQLLQQFAPSYLFMNQGAGLMSITKQSFIELLNEQLFPLVQAVEKATGRRVHLCTCLRWGSKGSVGVRLETVVLGGRRLTSPEAVLRYMHAVTEIKDGTAVTTAISPRQNERAAAKSAKKLADRLAKP
jgi:hypothetical protein